MINEIKENIWHFNFVPFGSDVYLIKLNKKNILIDTSSEPNKEALMSHLKQLNITPKQIDIIILTHDHWDHTDNALDFKNAKIYGHKKDFDFPEVIDIKKLPIKEFQIIETPGHTKGGIAILYEDVLFSGDTLFHNGIGRTDFPESEPEKMQESLDKLKKLNYKILCPGHEY